MEGEDALGMSVPLSGAAGRLSTFKARRKFRVRPPPSPLAHVPSPWCAALPAVIRALRAHGPARCAVQAAALAVKAANRLLNCGLLGSIDHGSPMDMGETTAAMSKVTFGDGEAVVDDA